MTLNFTIYMKEFFLYYPIVTAWRKSVDSKYIVPYNKSIQRRFNILFIKLFCICSFITLYSIHPNTLGRASTQPSSASTQLGSASISIEMLAKVVENCRIYEVSKNVVETSRKMLSKPVEKCCRNKSKFVEICRNLSKCRKMLSK